MLTAHAIRKAITQGDLSIEPFDESRLNPNSYNLCLGDTVKIYTSNFLDPKTENPTKTIPIPEKGLILHPNEIYLASTVEYTKCGKYIACIDGRSSIGRLGMQVHLTAGFGDIGFEGKWTLEISVIKPVRVYPGMEICQIYFEAPEGQIDRMYRGKYMYQDEPVESRMYKDFNNE